MHNRMDRDKSRHWPIDEIEDDVDVVAFERIRRGDRASMPASSQVNADRSAKKTAGSRRVKRTISQKSGGMHRRRQKKTR